MANKNLIEVELLGSNQEKPDEEIRCVFQLFLLYERWLATARIVILGIFD